MTKEQLIEGVARAIAIASGINDGFKSAHEFYPEAQAVIDYLSPMMREVVADLEDISKRGEEPFTSHQWLFYSRDVAKKRLASLECWREKGGE